VADLYRGTQYVQSHGFFRIELQIERRRDQLGRIRRIFSIAMEPDQIKPSLIEEEEKTKRRPPLKMRYPSPAEVQKPALSEHAALRCRESKIESILQGPRRSVSGGLPTILLQLSPTHIRYRPSPDIFREGNFGGNCLMASFAGGRLRRPDAGPTASEND